MTERDEEIVRALCCKIRYFTIAQIAQAWWTDLRDAHQQASRRLRQLKKSGWLIQTRVLARPLLRLETPIVRWRPGATTPDFSTTSKTLQQRWRQAVREEAIVLASPKAKGIFGGRTPNSVKNLCQTTHDLHVAEVFLLYRRTAPTLAQQWIGEDALVGQRPEGKIPDALLRSDDGILTRAIEFGGAYGPTRVAAFHDYCQMHELTYELW